MMKSEIMIVSDNHGATKLLAQMLDNHRDADFFFHCGDSNLAAEHSLMKNFICVKGNTDYMERYPLYQYAKLTTGENVWITHGHKQYVREKAAELISDTFTQKPIPDIVLYGHTHRVNAEMFQDVLFINPGSISQPRDGNPPSYAKLTITTTQYLVELYCATENSILKEWRFPR